MTKGDLDRVTFLHRPVKPFALALALSQAVLVGFNLRDADVLDGSLWGNVVMTAAAISFAALAAGWWFRSQRMEEAGLALAAGTWVTRSVTILLVDSITLIGFWLSLCWSIAAVGAFLLERRDGNDRAT